MTIALSHGGPTIYDSAAPSDEVLVGTARGVVRLARRDGSWQPVETTLPDLHIGAAQHRYDSRNVRSAAIRV